MEHNEKFLNDLIKGFSKKAPVWVFSSVVAGAALWFLIWLRGPYEGISKKELLGVYFFLFFLCLGFSIIKDFIQTLIFYIKKQ